MGHDDEFRPPLPPDDRIWRHPSEVAAAARARPAPTTGTPKVRASVATVAVSALIGATLSIGIVAALGGFDGRVVERRVAVDPAGSLDGENAVAAVTSRTTPSVAGIAVRVGDEWTDGNAVVLRSDGYLVTTEPLVADADQIEVHVGDGDRRRADVVGGDALTDVAVLHVGGDDLVPAVTGSARDLAVGDDALAVGLRDGGGWEPILTTCVVTAVGQRLDRGGTTLHGIVLLDTDVPQDTVGSPVVDHRGAVIGVVSSFVSGMADDEGVTPVIPIDDVIDVAEEIMEHGYARHVWLGVGGRDLDRETADELGVSGGAAVSEVLSDSPAERSGLTAGDVITQVGDTPVTSMSELVLALRRHEPGDTVILTVARDGETTTLDAELDERK